MNVKNLFLYLLPDIQMKKQILEREYRYKNMNIEANYDKWVGGNWCYKEFDNSDLELINYIHKSVDERVAMRAQLRILTGAEKEILQYLDEHNGI